ncbi:MAG: alpha/beta fold hydrolase [Mycobacteriaceae bacterium]
MTANIALPDGRTMSIAEWGAPEGTPVLFLHGTPGGRLSSRKYADTAASHGLRLIAPDRPGYGGSSPATMTLTDYARDLEHLCSQLSLPRVNVLAGSAGAAYALACAAAVPGLVDRVAVFSGIAPMTPDEVSTLIPVNQELHGMADDPDRLMPALEGLRTAVLSGDLGDTVPADPALTDALEPGIHGMATDYANVFTDWGFDVRSVRAPVLWIHGSADTNAPVSAARRVASQLPSGEFTEVPGGVHSPSPETLEKAMAFLA